MDVIYHRLIQKDLNAALTYYEAEGGTRLGDRFFAEAEATAEGILENPKQFHFIEKGLKRRAPFRSFPYHFIYEENADRVRFLVLRHDKRHPNYGLRRS